MADTDIVSALPNVQGFGTDTSQPVASQPAATGDTATQTEPKPRDVSNDPVYIVHAQHYGFDGDKGEDLHSKNGVGDFNNPLSSGSSIAMSPDMVQRFNASPGEQFIFTDRSGNRHPFTYGATTNDNLRGTIDVYDKDGSVGELGQGIISRPGANGPRIPALQTSNTEIQKLPLSFGMRVATPDDVANAEQYFKNGGDPNAIPLDDRIGLALAKNPNFFKDNPDIYYNYIWKPSLAPQVQQQKLNDTVNGLLPGLVGTVKDIVAGAANQINMFKDSAEMFVRIAAAGNPHDPGYQTTESRLAQEMATGAQGVGGGVSDAYNMVTGAFNGALQITRPLFEMTAKDPQSREELDRQYAMLNLNTADDQQKLATLGRNVQNFAGEAYKFFGNPEFGQKIQTAQPNESAARGIATFTNPINYVGELAGAATQVVKPLFFGRVVNAAEDVAGAAARKAGLDATQIMPTNPELSAANPAYVETRSAMAQLAPAQRAATDDLAQKTANLNSQLTSLDKISGDPGTVTSLMSQALQTGANIAQTVGKLPEMASAVKNKLIDTLSLGNPIAKSVMSSVADKMLGYGVFEHFGPVGTAIASTLEHLPEIGDAVSSVSRIMGKELMYGEATIPYWRRVAEQTEYVPKWAAAALDSPAMGVLGGAVPGAATGAVLGGLQGAGTTPGGGIPGAISGAAFGGIQGMAGAGFGQWQRFRDPNQYLLQARGDWKRYRDTLNTNKVIPMPQPVGEAAARPTTVVPPTRDAINQRAYEISQQRQAIGQTGDPQTDWLQAERELTAKAQAPAPPLLGSERDNFDRLSPSNQLLLAQSASHFPDLKVNYVNDPSGSNGFHYFDNAGRSNIQVNLANPDSVIRGVLAHELMHGAAHNGMLPEIYDSLFGNPTTGAIGQYTARGPDGKPLGTNLATDRYYTNQQFNNLAGEYKNKMAQNGLPTAHLTDFDIAKEIYAEHGVDYMLSGAPILDANSAFRPIMANKNAIKTASSKMGYTFDESGKMIGAPGGTISGTGLFTDLQRNPAFKQLAQSYFRTTQREGSINSEEQVTHRFTRRDMQNPNVADTWLTNAAEIVRNPDGTAQRNPLTGEPIYRTPKQVADYNAGFANAMRSGLEALPEDQRADLGIRRSLDEKGRENIFMRYLPDNVLDSLALTNQYNPHQINSLRLASRVLADKGQPGMEMRFFYHKALGPGKRYGGFEGTEKIAVPYGIEITGDNNVNIKSADFNQLTQNYQRMARRAPFRDLWNSPSEFTQDAHAYFTNHANGRPGADAIGTQKRDAINALTNLDVLQQREANPLVDRMPASVRPIIKSYRIDRANQISATGAIKPFISEEQYYQMKRNYLPGAAEGAPLSYLPRGTPKEAAPPDTTAIPVTMRTTRAGETVPQKIDYGITSAPLISDKLGGAPTGENNFGHVDFLTKGEQQRLTQFDKASAVSTYADKLVDEFAKWKDNKDVMAAKPWYKDVRGLLKKGFGKDAELFGHLLAATSPQQGVVENWNDALAAYHRYRSGAFDNAIREFKRTGVITEDMKPTKANGSKFAANSDEVLKVLAGTWLDSVQGPKTPNFFANLFGRGKEATIDKWAARTMRRLGFDGVEGAPDQWRLTPPSEKGVSDLDFAFSQQVFHQAADRLGMDPHELQAVMWYAEKHLWAEKGWSRGGFAAAKASYIPMLKAYAEHVSKTPSFNEVSPEEFIAGRNKTTRPGFLSDLKPEDLSQHKVFTNQAGTVGAAVDPNGDIKNVFNNSGVRGAGAHAVIHAINNLGGRTLDAFEPHLPNYYAQFGFQETGRSKFDPAQAPANWNYKKNGTPDVVFMKWNGYPQGGEKDALGRAWDKTERGWVPREKAK